MKNKKGFTLIELLAVIIILGILMIIAIPSVTNYINNSRKSAYVDTAKEIIAGARNLVNQGDLEMFSTETTYYIPVSCISTENGSKSPYGDFDVAYVLVTYTGSGYNYYWVSRDVTGQGVKDPVSAKDLDEEIIESDIAFDYIKTTVSAPETGKDTIKVLDKETCKTFEETDSVVYPSGKTKATVVVGDIVTIGTEEFYVVSNDGDDLVLLSHYNLNVGNSKKTTVTEGLQDSDVKGWLSSGTSYGTLSFSVTPNLNYWSSSVSSYPANVYNDSSNIYQYVDYYKDYLKNNYNTTIKEARLLTYNEAIALGCSGSSCSDAPDFVKETGYWLGTASNNYHLWCVRSTGNLYTEDYSGSYYYGVRPVIVI